MKDVTNPVLLLSVVVFLGGCAGLKKGERRDLAHAGNIAVVDASVTYTPIEPVSFWDRFASEDSVPACRALDVDPGCSATETLANFPNDATQVSVFELEAGGSVSAPFVGLSSRGSVYRVIVDYVKYRTDIIDGCAYRSGIGIRMKAELKTSKSDLNISSPVSIGVEAQLGHLSGSLRFETIGLSGKTITTLVPIPSQISAESIQKSMEAAASIKANIYNGDGRDVVVEPQVFASKCTKADQEPVRDAEGAAINPEQPAAPVAEEPLPIPPEPLAQ